MTPKELLLNDKALAEWWGPIGKDPRFDRVCNLVKADLFDNSSSVEENKGARKVISTLKEIAITPIAESIFPSPGLTHEFNPQTFGPPK